MDDRAHSAAHLRATLKAEARNECDEYVALPTYDVSRFGGERDRKRRLRRPAWTEPKVLLLTRFFRRLTKKYGELERCFGASNEASEMTPFQFFLPNASAREHRVHVECAVEKKKVPAVKICTDATSFEKSMSCDRSF